MITNPRYQRYALDLAHEVNITVQEAVRVSGGTNGAAIHLSNGGVPVIVIDNACIVAKIDAQPKRQSKPLPIIKSCSAIYSK